MRFGREELAIFSKACRNLKSYRKQRELQFVWFNYLNMCGTYSDNIS